MGRLRVVEVLASLKIDANEKPKMTEGHGGYVSKTPFAPV